MLTETEIDKIVVNTAYQIHAELGPGLDESAYLALMLNELSKRGLKIKSEVPGSISHGGLALGTKVKTDLIVEDKVIIELKSLAEIQPVHIKHLQLYLRITGKKLGLLINFGDPSIKNAITRVVNGLLE